MFKPILGRCQWAVVRPRDSACTAGISWPAFLESTSKAFRCVANWSLPLRLKLQYRQIGFFHRKTQGMFLYVISVSLGVQCLGCGGLPRTVSLRPTGLRNASTPATRAMWSRKAPCDLRIPTVFSETVGECRNCSCLPALAGPWESTGVVCTWASKVEGEYKNGTRWTQPFQETV